MQCLMMDSSFSMVTMQGEDSGIAWETNPSCSATPWASEAGDFTPPVPVRPATPGSHPAGKIIFEMDEEMISRQRKTKERASGQKSRVGKRPEVLELSSDNISGRPELVEVSQPNVKADAEGEQEEEADHLENKMQRLFSIVSEGSEILNIVVPPKMATVDEEESREMADNLSYLEEVPVPRASEEIQNYETLTLGEPEVQSAPPATSPRVRLQGTMDPPGAPVARPPGRAAVGNLDYFEAFFLVDAQAPGGPAMISPGQEVPEAGAPGETNNTETQRNVGDVTVCANMDRDESDTVSLGEITSELLDDVFYAGTDSNPMKSLDSAHGGRAAASSISRLPSKPSGSSLFGSQEDILTPIFLPEGPPKIIDPILLEEPKAMAFLYTDLYEEALGSRKKEEDAESVTSEKSFHSRHSDREARGYLEKFVLIDETPVVEAEHSDKEKPAEGEPRVLTGDGFDVEDFLPRSEHAEMQQTEEITDFFRSSANSSPCDAERLPPPLEEDDTEVISKKIPKVQKSVSIAEEKVPEVHLDPLSLSNFEFPPEEPDWGGMDDPPTAEEDVFKHEELWKHEAAISKPDPPPRKKTTSKARLDLTPLTPVDGIPMQNQEEAGGKEQREEEKETASPAETTDDRDGVDGGETISEAALSEAILTALKMEISASDGVQDGDETTTADENGEKTGEEETRTEADTVAAGHNDPKEADVETEVNPEKPVEGSAAVPPTKTKGQCIIL